MHGIIRTQNFDRNSSETSYIDINRIVVRYNDGREVAFVPEAGRDNFSEDDMLELVKVLTRASSTAEWAEAGDLAGPGG
jgi:hypothetical protein